ncbi:MAG: hypothetical protein COA58_07980 [Bacteroidetes bacterium]|nr:MAG: hypothetical protein COA58_07980 [Bacteroidota bacterium]
MKCQIYILLILISTIFSCSINEEKATEYYIETQPTFSKLRHGRWITNEWIRKPQNLKMINETFKKFGYMRLISGYLNNNPLIIQGIYINKKPYHIIDSLIISYENKNVNTKYYQEFWDRRKKEQNDSIVYSILNDIKYSYKSKLSSYELSYNVNEHEVNDTLFQLLQIEYNTLTDEVAMGNFKTLVDLDFHESAFNILHESYQYSDFNWNRDSLNKELKTTEKYTIPWFTDNTK